MNWVSQKCNLPFFVTQVPFSRCRSPPLRLAFDRLVEHQEAVPWLVPFQSKSWLFSCSYHLEVAKDHPSASWDLLRVFLWQRLQASCYQSSFALSRQSGGMVKVVHPNNADRRWQAPISCSIPSPSSFQLYRLFHLPIPQENHECRHHWSPQSQNVEECVTLAAFRPNNVLLCFWRASCTRLQLGDVL